MRYVVFAQSEPSHFDTARLEHNARTHLRIDLEVLAADESDPVVRLRLGHPRLESPAELDLRPRAANDDDRHAAHDAEQRGRAAGMGTLADRCPAVWELDPLGAPPEWAILLVCAALASVALGPVLPPDGSTLLGVRSARERADRLLGEIGG